MDALDAGDAGDGGGGGCIAGVGREREMVEGRTERRRTRRKRRKRRMVRRWVELKLEGRAGAEWLDN